MKERLIDRKFFFVLFFIFFFLHVFSISSFCEEAFKDFSPLNAPQKGWEKVWENEETILFIHPELILKTQKGVFAIAKLYPGKNKRETLLKKLEKAKKELLEAGFEVPDYWEEFEESFLDSASYFQRFFINCEEKKVTLIPEKTTSMFNVEAVVELTPGGYGEALFKRFCNRD